MQNNRKLVIPMNRIMVFDSTLRDGSHANKHQFTEKQIADYCSTLDESGMDVIFVGHGNGLGASSSQIGFSLVNEMKMLRVAREHLKKTKLGAYLIPGFGTIRDQISKAIDLGVDVFEIGCHCTEADISEQHINYIAKSNITAYGTLMMFHMASPDIVLENAKKMESYGAAGVILMDSAGASTNDMIIEYTDLLTENLSIPVGCHAHNNLGLAVSNTYTAIEHGAQIIDGTLRGYGAGAGNCQLEAICALLYKMGWDSRISIDFFQLLKKSDELMDSIMHESMGISPISIASGVAGVFSAFKEHAVKAGEAFGVDPKEILLEVGKRKAVGGQEDIIIQIASEISGMKE